jgi:Ca2+-binding EF-hand superfamily protein
VKDVAGSAANAMELFKVIDSDNSGMLSLEELEFLLEFENSGVPIVGLFKL